MADEGRPPGADPQPQPAQPQQPQQQVQQIQVPVDLTGLATGYVNWFRFTGSAEELIIDLGLAPQLGQMPPVEPIKITHRLVMNFYTAKRLYQNLHRAIAIYESHYGVLETDPQKRMRGAGGQQQMPPRPPGGGFQ
jgi:Protein of unknown function (DUF3467)